MVFAIPPLGDGPAAVSPQAPSIRRHLLGESPSPVYTG